MAYVIAPTGDGQIVARSSHVISPFLGLVAGCCSAYVRGHDFRSYSVKAMAKIEIRVCNVLALRFVGSTSTYSSRPWLTGYDLVACLPWHHRLLQWQHLLGLPWDRGYLPCPSKPSWPGGLYLQFAACVPCGVNWLSGRSQLPRVVRGDRWFVHMCPHSYFLRLLVCRVL